jgi:threonine/homoserine/homoserine lactone efflux protein
MVTPGPNNLILMHSCLNFGIKRSMRHFLGTFVGLIGILLLVAIGLGMLLNREPTIKLWLKIIGSCYILYLAWKVSQMDERKGNTNVKKPLTLIQAILFQWVNPKAWMVAIIFFGMSHFSSIIWVNSLIYIIIVITVMIPCLFIWMYLGKVIEKILKTTKQRKVFNLVLALFLVVTVAFLWI